MATAGKTNRRDEHSGRLLPSEAPRMEFEVRIQDGPEGERLRLKQAQVIQEVVEWVAQKQSAPGLSNAA